VNPYSTFSFVPRELWALKDGPVGSEHNADEESVTFLDPLDRRRADANPSPANGDPCREVVSRIRRVVP